MYADRRNGIFGALPIPNMGGYGTPPYAPTDAPTPPMPDAPDAGHGMAITAYHPAARTLAQKLGVLADAFGNTHANGDRYAELDQRGYNTWNTQAQAQLQKAAQFAQFKSEYDYKRANPEAPNNDTVNDYQFILKNLGPEKAKEYLSNVAAGPPIPVRNSDGTYNILSRGDINAPQVAPQPAPPGVTFTPLDDGPVAPGMSASTAAPVLRGAQSAGFMTSTQANAIRQSFGPNGQAAFNKWLATNRVQIKDQ